MAGDRGLGEVALLGRQRRVCDALETLGVPLENASQLLDLLDGVAALERLEHRVGAVRRRALEVALLEFVVAHLGPVDVGSYSLERKALSSDSSNVRPMAIASPVDFIAVVSSKSTSSNLSLGHRGTLVTT